jgi:hypothetical protein
MQITEQQLKRIIREQIAGHTLEEGLADWIRDFGEDITGAFKGIGEFFADIGEASYESFVGLLVRYILSWMGLDKEGLIATTIGQTVGNITFEEWKSLFSDHHEHERCKIIATRLSEGLAEAIAKKIMWYLEDGIKRSLASSEGKAFSTDVGLFLAFTQPNMVAAVSGGYVLSVASLGITEEYVANMIRDTDVIKNFIDQASVVICDFIDEKLPKFMSQKKEESTPQKEEV